MLDPKFKPQPNHDVNIVFNHITPTGVECAVAFPTEASWFSGSHVHLFMDSNQHVYRVQVVLNRSYDYPWQRYEQFRDLVKSYFVKAFDNFDDKNQSIPLDPFFVEVERLRRKIVYA